VLTILHDELQAGLGKKREGKEKKKKKREIGKEEEKKRNRRIPLTPRRVLGRSSPLHSRISARGQDYPHSVYAPFAQSPKHLTEDFRPLFRPRLSFGNGLSAVSYKVTSTCVHGPWTISF